MTAPTRLERTLTGILDDLSAGPTPEYLDDLFVRTGRMRQRPAWTFPERWLPMSDSTRSRAFAFAPPWRTIAIALTLIALLAAVAFAYVGSQRRVPAPFGPAANGLIVYDNGGDIYTGDPVTGEERLVVGGKDFDAEPGFSPDGTLIVFVRTAGLGVDLYTVRPDGTDLKRVTTAPIASMSAAKWIPDSKGLAVIHGVDGHGRLDLFDFSGRPPRRLAGEMDIDSLSYRPPLAQEIVFRAVVDGKFGLFVMDADGTNTRTLIEPTIGAEVDQNLNAATYSADGSRIFYQRWFPESIQLWVMNADGTDQHRFDAQVAPAWSGLPAVSPDGRWVAYWHVFEDGRATQRVSVVRADGTGPVIQTGPELTGTAAWGWAPDSSKILMVPNDGADGPRHYLLDPAGGSWTTTAWQTSAKPDWQRLAP